jgi:hypothetical protein
VHPRGGRPVYVKFDEESEEWNSQYAKMLEIFKEAGVESSEIEVWRRGKKDTKFSFVETITPDGFNLQSISESYGGGKYHFKTKLNGRPGPTFAIEIDSRVKGELDRQQVEVAQQPHTDPIAMLKTVKDVLHGTGDGTSPIMVAMLETMAKEKQSSQALIIGLATAFAPVIAAIVAPRPREENKLLEILLPILLNKPNADLASQMTFIKEMKALASNDKDDGPGMMEKLITLAAGALPQLAGAMLPQVQPVPVKQITDGPNAAPGMPPPSAVAPPPPNLEAIVPRVYAGMLAQAARKDADPDSWADIIADVSDDAQWTALIGLLHRADWWQVIANQLPELASYEAWMNRLKTAILEPDDDEPDLTSEPASVNPSSVS